MPRSFLVKKVKSDEDRQPNQYRIRDAFEDSVVSLKAATPFTPALQPLSVRISNGNFLFTVKLLFTENEEKLLHVVSTKFDVYFTTFNCRGFFLELCRGLLRLCKYIEIIKIIFTIHILRSLIEERYDVKYLHFFMRISWILFWEN